MFAKFKYCIPLIMACNMAVALDFSIAISGVNKELAEKVKANLSLHDAQQEEKLSSQRVLNLFNIAPDEIKATLEAFGYYAATIDKTLNDSKEPWLLNFKITLNQPIIITNSMIKITGDGENDQRLQQELHKNNLTIGTRLEHEKYEDFKRDLLTAINSYGYLEARYIEKSIAIDRQQYTAAIKLNILTGQQYYFGDFTIENEDFPTEFLQRFIPFAPGDKYTTDEIIQLQKRYQDADLFSKIRIDPKPNLLDEQDNIVPLTIRLTTKPRNRYTGSIGYGTDTSFRGSLGWQRIRMHSPGHKIATGLQASNIKKNIFVNYSIPGKKPAKDKYVISASSHEETIEETYSLKTDVGAMNFMQSGNWQNIYGVNLFQERFRLLSRDPKETVTYLLPMTKIIWRNTENIDDSISGTRMELSARLGLESIASAANVLQIEGNGKRIWPTYAGSRFILRVSLGAVASNDFDSLPPSLRFYAGGDYSVRGFGYNKLGPRQLDDDGDEIVTGGRYLVTLSTELEKPVYDKLAAAIFADAGNAMLDLNQPLGVGLGGGIRYQTPIGAFRFDLAKPLNQVKNKHWRIHLTFGADI